MKQQSRIILLALILLGACVSFGLAGDRAVMRRIDPYQHNIQELTNATAQIVIDSTWDYVTLDSGQVDTSDWVTVNSLWQGYGNLCTYIVDLDSGSICVRFEEYYFATMGQVRPWGGSDSLLTCPFSTAGQWSVDIPFLGGEKFRIITKARANSTRFKPAIQTMRLR